ncbi:unnamed protein product [Rhizophagus irregularis]|nr:unnamed protein product [Rhizophagus irregularis]
MNSLHTAIISTLEEMNVKKYKNTPRCNNFPLELRQKYNYIHQINSLESLLKNGLFLLSQEFSNEFSATTTEKNELLLNFNHLWRRKSKWIIKIFHIVNSHFKHIGSSDTTNNPRQYDPNLPIREEWAKYYQPKMNIPDDAINKLSNPTTLEVPSKSYRTTRLLVLQASSAPTGSSRVGF